MMKGKQSKLFTLFGILFILCAVALTSYNIYDAHVAEKSADAVAAQLKSEIPLDKQEATTAPEAVLHIPAYIQNPDMEMPIQVIDGREYVGLLEIPAFELSLPVLSELTDAGLKKSPARYKGSAYSDNLIIGAHNYTSHFSNLRYLNQGDEVIFTDVDGNEFRYKVNSTETLLPTAVEEMESGEWALTLFTCTFGGGYRITVRCDKA